jgi:hypothetical protein
MTWRPGRTGCGISWRTWIRRMKLAFEKYYLWKSRHGYVRLP